jgi:hypothetical protein
MSFRIQFPGRRRRTRVVIETDLMRSIMERTMAVHGGGAQMMVYTGPSRNGKTTTAEHMIDLMEAQADEPGAFRAKHHAMPEIAPQVGHEQKRAIGSLYEKLIGRLDGGAYRFTRTDTLAEDLVHGLRQRNIQMVFIDEACGLSLGALGGLKYVIDAAASSGFRWPLTLVLIGMGRLPLTVQKVPQIRNRIADTCYFEPYAVEDVWDILSGVHPHFAALDRANPEHVAQVREIHSLSGGLPGLIIPFLDRLDAQSDALGERINAKLIRATRLIRAQDEARAVEAAQNGYPEPAPEGADESGAEAGAGGGERRPGGGR